MSGAAKPPRGGIRSQPPPAWLIGVVNPMVRRLMLSSLGRWTGGLALLHFTIRLHGHTWLTTTHPPEDRRASPLANAPVRP